MQRAERMKTRTALKMRQRAARQLMMSFEAGRSMTRRPVLNWTRHSEMRPTKRSERSSTTPSALARIEEAMAVKKTIAEATTMMQQ